MPKEKEALKQYIAFSYPQWKLVDYDSLEDAADMVTNDKADGFLMGASQALIYDNDQDFKSVPLTNTMEAEIPIIAMTANAFAEGRKRALDAGMNEHIAKPIDIEKMRAVILSVLNKQEN